MRRRDSAATLTLPVGKRDHMRGPATAPVTLVEYGDYECPDCKRAYPIVKEVRGTISGAA
jgi:protein-disulfide isomerase